MNEQIFELLQEHRFAELKEELSKLYPVDIVEILETVPKRELPVVFRILPKSLAADVFVEMDSDLQMLLINCFSDNELKEVFDELFLDDAADIIEEAPASVARRILRQADPQTRKIINQILAYPEDSAGSIMTTEYINLKKNMTVAEAFARIRKIGLNSKDIYVNYVTDDNRKLIGVVTVKDLLLADETEIVSDLMDTNVISVETTEDKEDAALIFEKYDFLTLPVVDNENRLVGIVTVDDAIDVLQEAATDDINMMAAITPSDKPYLKTSIFSIFKSRILWLLILMFSATITGMIITSFETALAAQVILTAFIPMLMNTGGNTGSQSSVTIIRGLSIGEIDFKDTFRVLRKEIGVSVICGIVLSVANFLKILLVDIWMLNNGITIEIAFVVSASLLLTVIAAKTVGCLLPIIAKKIGFDPAVMASPFITTMVDILSLIIYFNLAKVILKI